ncbi:MAG: uroporphyrinogen decarboxylase [Pseudomonadota bacterium]
MELKKLIRVLNGGTEEVPPIWLMRQAGRYLPEYRETRKQAGSFLDLCYNPELAIEVTLQPIRRFGFDAAILFSDILVVPDALGRRVEFKEGVGPLLEPITKADIPSLDLDNVLTHLDPVLKTVSGLRRDLPQETTLIGFCGAPWTVATYMIAGRGTGDQAPARLFAFEEPDAFQEIIDVLVEASAEYLKAQLNAGAEVVQIFDSWAGILGGDQFERWCIKPVSNIVEKVRRAYPDAKIIGFPKSAGSQYDMYRKLTGVDVLGLDWSVPVKQAKALQEEGPVQGMLDPLRLIAGGDALNDGIDQIMDHLGQGPLIFNLGHGITPQTPIKHVEQLVSRVRGR